ncbi:MAG: ISL3 family transposase [Candidatus Hatepunaea meridiana]|nr:ISL3 family transposase [Candidatus Hatepunaea meridiana]
MSTSLLYHDFGIRDYDYVRTDYEKKRGTFHIKQNNHSLCCPNCRSTKVVKRGQKQRRFRTVPIGNKIVEIALNIPRVECRSCGKVRQVKVTFADPKRTYTRAFERYVLELSKVMTIQDIARHLKISWDIIKDIQKRNLMRRYSKPKLKHLRLLAVDEISVAKGHRYLTVVLDLKTGVVVFVGDGKGADALIPFFKRLRRSKAKIDAVAIDMSPAYILAIKEKLPESAIVFDHFHVVKLLNEKLSNFRRDLQREASKIEKQVFKGTRWLLLKNPENLDDKRNERQRLEAALKINQPLATIGAYRTGLLAYYDYSISTGPLEGTNNKIKTMKRQAYGFRDMQFFKLKIMAIHETKYALVG